MLIYIIIFLIGVLIGIIIDQFCITSQTNGEFIVDKSDSEKDIYRLDLKQNFEDLEKQKRLILEVKHEKLD